jgi:hypothetical protein
MLITSIIHQGQDNVAFPTTEKLQSPMHGALQVLMFASGSSTYTISSITAGSGNIWQQIGSPNTANGNQDTSQAWYTHNATPRDDETLTIVYAGTSPGHASWLMYDIKNAPANPFDKRTISTGDQTANSATLALAPPALTPAAADGLILLNEQHEFNTANGINSPGFFDAVTWDGQSLDGPEASDQNAGWAHFHVTSTTAQTFTWNLVSATDPMRQWTAQAVAFNSGGGATPPPGVAFVQGRAVDSGSGTTATLAYSANVSGGSLLTVAVRQGSGAANNLCTVTDSNGDTFTEAGFQGSGDGHTNRIFWAKNAVAGPCTVTVTLNSAATLRWAIHEFSGLSTTAPFDQFSRANGTGTAVDVSPSITTATATELLFGFSTVENTAAFTPGTGYTQAETVSSKLATQYRIVTSTGTYSSPQTLGTSGPWTETMVTFK